MCRSSSHVCRLSEEHTVPGEWSRHLVSGRARGFQSRELFHHSDTCAKPTLPLPDETMVFPAETSVPQTNATPSSVILMLHKPVPRLLLFQCSPNQCHTLQCSPNQCHALLCRSNATQTNATPCTSSMLADNYRDLHINSCCEIVNCGLKKVTLVSSPDLHQRYLSYPILPHRSHCSDDE